jgi:hypothetical protein
MMMTQERMILKGQVQLEEMAGVVRRCVREGRPIDEVERGLWSALLRLGRTLLAGYVEGVGSGDVGDMLIHDGRELRRLELQHERRYVSVFGELTIIRCVYGTRETQKHEVVPTDALLGLPDSEFSYVLQEWDQSFCVEDSYGESRRKKGEKANKKRMACVGGVYTIDPFVRAAANVVDEVLRDARKSDRPKPCHKQLRAELTRQIDGVEVNGKERIFSWFAEQAKLRNPRGRKKVVCVMDGERALWKKLLAFVPGVVCILDLSHTCSWYVENKGKPHSGRRVTPIRIAFGSRAREIL